jgi:ElaB/YqjD/DUF883 family membrane-anchored ribosome-binding protein
MRGEMGGRDGMLGGVRRPARLQQTEIRNAVKAMNADQVRQNADEGLDAAVDQFESARERVQSAFEQGKEQWMQIQDQAVEYSKQAAEETDKFVREKPWQAVGIAAAIGLVAGLLIRRR